MNEQGKASGMCRCHIDRRAMLKLSGASSLSLLAGCDDIDLVSDATVEAMGLQAWAEIRTATPASPDPALQRILAEVAERLLIAAGEASSNWEVLVFRGSEINAFALPGRKIGIYEGMFGVVQNRDQLAAIVGHEIGHLQAEHSQERMSAQVAQNWGLRALSWVLRAGEVEYAAEIAAALGVGLEYGLVLPYSRRQELEADRLGLITMAGAGFQPAEAVSLWQRMEAATAGRGPEFLATHPAPQSRIAAIKAMLPKI
ncbi:M48 family peptidase [Paracoccus liaowanqingii]|uniref:M48 family peptidase n=1 Tax=Paracoccus liaowanqingii TaxID=2560053 RepID=A0A4Z1CAW5_9RHOB|nr:M48 family metallopeptidase [Paracoccus liaowanqingii]TGN61580.1 M48 family peptidase [Paracoccus liaowanqingii]